MGMASSNRKMGVEYEIYSQFSGKPQDLYDRHRKLANPSTTSMDSQSQHEVLQSLKSNAFLDTETFETFLTRRKKGKRTMFLNKPTPADAREMMLEYRK